MRRRQDGVAEHQTQSGRTGRRGPSLDGVRTDGVRTDGVRTDGVRTDGAK